MTVNLHVVTGILGSGKTILLQHLLEAPTGEGRSAVVVGEYAEEGLDGDLLRSSGAEVREITATGRGSEAKSYVEDVRALVRHGAFRRVFLETSGVTQISQVARDLMADPVIAEHARFGRTTTVVDCGAFEIHDQHFHRQLWAQVAVADVVVLNKTDKANETSLAAMRDRVRALRPDADVLFAYMGQIMSQRVLGPLEDDWTPAILGVDWTDDPPAEFESFVYRSKLTCYDRVMFGHRLLNLPGGRIARFKGVLRSYDGSHVVNGLPGQLDWGRLGPRVDTAIAFIGLDLDGRVEGIGRILDAELEGQQDPRR